MGAFIHVNPEPPDLKLTFASDETRPHPAEYKLKQNNKRHPLHTAAFKHRMVLVVTQITISNSVNTQIPEALRLFGR